MKQTQAILSTYTADVSGVCSALFELGGMTVMHDASGCNSTYNTHDEPRWYDHDSLVFISGLSEMEAVLGDDEKFIGDIVEAAEQLRPRFIAVAGTPIPMLTGCDLPAIAAQAEARTGIPAFGFQTNGMHSYVAGAGAALAAYAERMTSPTRSKQPRTVNILGATPLDFSVNGSVESIREVLTRGGWNVLGCWAMGSSPEELEGAGAAQVNLVISAVGLEAAKVLQRKFGTPYVLGVPYGRAFSEKLLEALESTGQADRDPCAFGFLPPAEDPELILIGESVTCRSLAAAVYLEHALNTRVICPVETASGILSSADLHLEDEEDLAAALKGAKAVAADPLYRPIVPAGTVFYPLPHEAFSGRIFRREIPNLIGRLPKTKTI